jgi:hypothetical protein
MKRLLARSDDRTVYCECGATYGGTKAQVDDMMRRHVAHSHSNRREVHFTEARQGVLVKVNEGTL